MSITTGLFNDGYVPIMDGVTITVKNYAYWLEKTLGPTYVVTPYVPNYEDQEPFKVIRFLSMPTIVRPPYRIGLPDLDLRLQYILKNRDFDIVHAHSPFTAGIFARRVAKAKGIPIIATFHSKYRDDFQRIFAIKSIVDDQIKRIVDFYYSVNHVWVPQESVARTLREYGYKGPYEVMENGIDMTPVKDIGDYRKQGADYLKLPEGHRVGLYVGQHILEKNLEFLLESLPLVMQSLPDFRMVFVGDGYAKTQLIGLAEDLGIADRVIFHNVVFDRKILQAIYARGDVFLFPSLYDNAPLVVREAAAFKTPSVLIKGATAAEVIKDGINGYLSENDREGFAQRIVQALSAEEEYEKIAETAQSTLCRTWEDVVSEVKGRYLKILERWER
ncbi:MAG: glycosyltransferase [Spirochaetia bacterium]|nr:glycosyltransferase [Candidatus Paceibacterota bacterium]MDD3982289.1 glycosyltransferase [Spirochaetales bacterium]MDX9783174.1 glycosyltransferase [Spirochaetia bacterium]